MTNSATKTCSVCAIEKPAADFNVVTQKPSGRQYLQGRCKPCSTIYHREYRQRPDVKPKMRAYKRAHQAGRRERPEVKAYNRNARLRSVYGISHADYERMLAAQDCKCAICGKPPEVRITKTGALSAHARLHIDHDHKTGAVRGLLCHGCNVGLGNFRDDYGLLASAAGYLKRSESKAPVPTTSTHN